MKLHILILLTLTFCLSAIGQTTPLKRNIVWGASKTCEDIYPDKTDSDILECDSFVMDGISVRTIYYNNLMVSASFTDDGDYIVTGLRVENYSPNRVLVQPEKSAILYYLSEKDYRAGSKSVFSEYAVPSSKVADKINGKGKFRDALAGALSGMSQPTKTATVNSRNQRGETVTSTVTMPDDRRQTEIERRREARQAENGSRAVAVLDSALLTNTVFPDKGISGLVYFKKFKKASFASVSFRLDDMAFTYLMNTK